MAHVKSLRNKWLAAAAAHGPERAAVPPGIPPSEGALLPKKRLLEANAARHNPAPQHGAPFKKPRPDDSGAAIKGGGQGAPAAAATAPAARTAARTAAAAAQGAPTAQQQQHRQHQEQQLHPKAKGELSSRANAEGVTRPEAPPASKALAGGMIQEAARPQAAAAAPIKQEQQHEHAGSNPSSMRLEGGHAGAAAKQQATSAAKPMREVLQVQAEAAGVEQGSSNLGTPVEVLVAPTAPSQLVGEMVVTMFHGHDELLHAVHSRFADCLPPATVTSKPRLVYQDLDGDWLLLQPQAPWQFFTRTVRRLVVTCQQ